MRSFYMALSLAAGLLLAGTSAQASEQCSGYEITGTRYVAFNCRNPNPGIADWLAKHPGIKFKLPCYVSGYTGARVATGYICEIARRPTP